MKNLTLLSSPADGELLKPILEELRKKGLRAEAAAPGTGAAAAGTDGGTGAGKDGVVLVALTEHFYSDSALTGRLLALLGEGAGNVLPLRLDSSKIPDALMNSLYSRNIIPAADRDAALVAERIFAALPKKKNRLPLMLTVAAVLLAAVVGLLVWRGAHSSKAGGASAAEEVSVPSSFGLTEEDLADIELVFITGDRVKFYRSEDLRQLPSFQQPDWDELATRNWEDDGPHYYSREDGQEIPMARYEDLCFLALMPRLRGVHLCNVEATLLPDLSESAQLEELTLADCNIPDLEWLRGAAFLSIDLLNTTGSVRDFSPLTDCRSLKALHIDLTNCREADLSQLAPPELDWFWLNGGTELRGGVDLSSLSRCAKLKEVQLEDVPVSDISFLSGAKALELLQMQNLSRLSDIAVLSGMTALRELRIDHCDSIRDYRPIGGCSALETLSLNPGENRGNMPELNFLGGLKKLGDIGLFNVQLENLDFLNEIGQRRSLSNFDIAGVVDDWSGLAGVSIWNRLCLDPDDGVSLAELLPYLEGATVRELALRRFSDVDFAALPRVTVGLELDRCGITDLSTMPEDWKGSYLNLSRCQALRSLEGIQNQSGIGAGGGSLLVSQCPRLTDWSALESMSLGELHIIGGYSLPDFSTFRTGELRLDSVEIVTDLNFLESMDAARRCSFTLVGMDELQNLSPLRRFHGAYLAVSPQLKEQAEDLVAAGNFGEFRIEYPEGGWNQDDAEITLLSLDELDTLPPALLRRVSRVCIAGDRVVDPDRYEVQDDWMHPNLDGSPGARLVDHQTGESISVGAGAIRDLSVLSSLTGLRDLRLYAQPLETLDGVQNFQNLEQLTVSHCESLTDASAAFALQNLWELNLKRTGIDSIQGVQNLWQLRSLNVSGTRVSDLAPLSGADLSAAYEREGLWLGLDDTDVEDFSPLTALEKLKWLDVGESEAGRWLDAVQDVSIAGLFCQLDSNDQLKLLARQHPELRELHIPRSEAVTDLTPLLALENLDHIKVSRSMGAAIHSLDGQNSSFWLEIEE